MSLIRYFLFLKSVDLGVAKNMQPVLPLRGKFADRAPSPV